MIDFESWWNSYAADDFRAANPDLDGRAVRPVWDAALTAAIAHYGKAMDAMLAAAPQPTAEQSSEHVPGLAGLIAAKTAEIEPLIPWQIRTAEQVEEYKDARRYRRLQILGAAPYGSKNLSKGTVLCFQSLDAFVDADLEAYPSRGEANAAPPAQSPVAVLQGAPGLDDHAAFEDAMVAAGYHVPERGDAFATQYLFQRDQDRFEGFQMARAALQVKGNAAPLTPAPAELKQDRDAAIAIWHKHCDAFAHVFGTDPASPVIDAMLEFAALSQRQDDTELLRGAYAWVHWLLGYSAAPDPRSPSLEDFHARLAARLEQQP